LVDKQLPSETAPADMVWIPGGEFSMGGVNPVGMMDGGHESMNDARPVHRVHVPGFFMDATEVTNKEFAAFVKQQVIKPWQKQYQQRKSFQLFRTRSRCRLDYFYTSSC
jgi:formylglycine-generating enzyme required for sulfatase activity